MTHVHRKQCTQYRIFVPGDLILELRYRAQVGVEQYVLFGSLCSVNFSSNCLLRSGSGSNKGWSRLEGNSVLQQCGGKRELS